MSLVAMLAYCISVGDIVESPKVLAGCALSNEPHDLRCGGQWQACAGAASHWWGVKKQRAHDKTPSIHGAPECLPSWGAPRASGDTRPSIGA